MPPGRGAHPPRCWGVGAGRLAEGTRTPGVRYPSLCCLATAHGRLPEWPKGAVCKTVGLAYVGSNPTPATNYFPQYQQVSAVIRNLVPVSTSSRSERSANRSLYQGTVYAPGSHSPSDPSPLTNIAFVYAVLTCENIPPGQHRLHVRADSAAIAVFEYVFA